MSGMTLGFMSLDITNLEILSKSGTLTQQVQSRRVIPLLKKHHLLLVTLLLMNAGANEALPIFLERLVNPVMAVVLGVTLILLFGEIIPQSLCSRWGLAIGASLHWFMWGLMAICSPIAWPVSKLLDFLIGEHEEFKAFKRTELKELISLHGIRNFIDTKKKESKDENKHIHVEEALTVDEIKIIKGALDLRHKTVLDRITPLKRCFMLNLDDVLDQKLLQTIVDFGHSRIPVYSVRRENIVGVILVKNLVGIERSTPPKVRSLDLQPLPVVPCSLELYHVLNIFQTGKSHMALVVNDVESGDITPLGIITLEDIIEELIQTDIEDETDLRKGGGDSDEDSDYNFNPSQERAHYVDLEDLSAEEDERTYALEKFRKPA
eukprot:TRINITY_DN4220_c0_g2_i9.p1 TRINITY_DN4220_c0_g2~~TRINITY_DN4220_c0_g2_i9.p1  ORF type:complete len:378 (-),score=82.36 TRINITY_DN4220_c0_g2_i9:185-1318(-)